MKRSTAHKVISYSVQKERKSIPLLGNMDRIVSLSLEFVKRHFTRSQVFPNLAETYRALESSHLLFFCFVHLNHSNLNFSLQMYELSAKLPNKSIKNLSKSALCYYSIFFCLFHRANRRFYELDFLVRQVVLLVEFLVRPRVREVLEGDKSKCSL